MPSRILSKISCQIAALTLFAPYMASAAPDLGLKKDEKVNFTIFHTTSSEDSVSQSNTQACMVANQFPQVAGVEQLAPGIKKLTLGHKSIGRSFGCVDFANTPDDFELIENFPADSYVPGPLNSESKELKIPLQFSLNANIGSEKINAAYARLLEKCEGRTCEDYSFMIMFGSYAFATTLPLSPKFKFEIGDVSSLSVTDVGAFEFSHLAMRIDRDPLKKSRPKEIRQNK